MVYKPMCSFAFLSLAIKVGIALASSSQSNNKVVTVPLHAVPFGFQNIPNPPVPYYVNHTTNTSTSSVNIQTPSPGSGSTYNLYASEQKTNPSKFQNTSEPGICCGVVLERPAPSTYNSSTHSNVPNPSSFTGSFASSNNPITGLLNISPILSNFTRATFADIVNYHDGSIVISPIYIQSQLALLQFAAGGKTYQLMKKRLNLNGLSSTSIEDNFNNFLKPLESSAIMSKANGIFISDKYEINPEFQNIATNSFHSPVQAKNYGNGKNVARSINKWVANQTDNHINHIIHSKDINKSTSIIVASAVYFYGLWKHEFATASIQQMNFYTNGYCLQKNSITMASVFDVAHFRCGPVPELNARVIEFPYRNSDMTMFILLPNECDGVAYVLDKLKTFDVNDLRGQKYAWVGLTMPLFNIEYSLNLDGALAKLGLGDIMTADANFNGMILEKSSMSLNDSPSSSNSQQFTNLFVSEFLHKVSINMTETAALAAHINIVKGRRQRMMGLGPELTSANAWLTYNINRPFVFIITNPSEVVVIGKFMGQ